MKTKMKALALALCAVLLVATTVFVTVAYLTSTTETVTNTFTVGNVKITLDETDTDDADETEASDKDITYGNSASRDIQNKYKLLPGVTYVKDPTVHVKADSEPSYIRMIVTITDITAVKEAFAKVPGAIVDNKFLPQVLVSGWNSNVWVSTNVINEDTAEDTATYEFRYYTIVDTLNNTLTTGSYNDTFTVYTEGAKLNGDQTSSVRSSNPTDDLSGSSFFDLEPLFTNVVMPNTLTNADLEKLSNADVQIKVEAHAIQAAGFDDADTAWSNFSK